VIAMDNLGLAFTWSVDDSREMAQLIALNSPPLIFTNTLADEQEARELLESMGHEVVVLSPCMCRHTIVALTSLGRKHNAAFICGRGWLTGWRSAIPRSVVMWGRNWSKAEVAQASLRLHGHAPFTRTFVYASPNDQAQTP